MSGATHEFGEHWTNPTVVLNWLACPRGETFEPGEPANLLEDLGNHALMLTLGGVALVPKSVLREAQR